MKINRFFINYGLPLFLSLITMVIGLIIGIRVRSESLNDAVKMIIVLAIGCGFTLMLFSIISIIIVKSVAKRYNLDSLGNDPILYDPLVIEIGYGLFPLTEKSKGAELVNQVQNLRKNISTEKGIVVPKVRIVDNAELELFQYRITTSRLGEVKLNEDELSDGARTITADLKDVIVRLNEKKKTELYPSVHDTIYHMYKKGVSIEDIAEKMNRSENNIRLIIETSEMNEKLMEMGYGKAAEEAEKRRGED